MDYGRLIILIGFSIYFLIKFYESKKLSKLILGLICIFGITTGRFLFKPYRETIINNYFLNVVNVVIFLSIVMLLIYNFYKIKKLKKS